MKLEQQVVSLELAKANKVSNQEIVRAIVEGFIDEAVFI